MHPSKALGIVLDSKLNFNTHVDQKIKKCNTIIGLMRQLPISLPRNALLTIFQNKLEKVHYRTCHAITDAIQGTSRAKLYDELGLHSLIK